MRFARAVALSAGILAGSMAIVGCGGGTSLSSSAAQAASLKILAPGHAIPTNETVQLTTTPEPAASDAIQWTVSGGDPRSGPGSIRADGLYTPPTALTVGSARVTVTATLAGNPSVHDSAQIEIAPGFLQPLSPENAAVGANGLVTVTGYLADVGGATGIRFALRPGLGSGSVSGAGNLAVADGEKSSDAESRLPSVLGTLSEPTCTSTPAGTKNSAYTYCSVMYSAPASIPTAKTVLVEAQAGESGERLVTRLLLNPDGTHSSPLAHQARQTVFPLLLGSSGGNGADYDSIGNRVADCCGGTLGALVRNQNSENPDAPTGDEYVLSNNHVLAMSDQGQIGDAVTQPGLIDSGCDPAQDRQVATLSTVVPLDNPATNVDAALALVPPGIIDPTGGILELGARQPDGTLPAAPPGVSSTHGKGETGQVGMTVAKSGRTTGLTCAGVEAIAMTVTVPYFTDCAETRPYLIKTYDGQISIVGDGFYDAGDSGSLLVDTATAEPVGLFFSGGLDANGISHGVANPVSDVLGELDAQAARNGTGANYSFVGGADHPVACLSYGDSSISAAQAMALSPSEEARQLAALPVARALVNPAAGILAVATGKSNDHPGEAAILVYTEEGRGVTVPESIVGVRTVAIPTTPQALANGVAPQTPGDTGKAGSSLFPQDKAGATLSPATLKQAIAIKQQSTAALLKANPAFFAVGVGQSLDDPSAAALVVYVDRHRVPAEMPAFVSGLRTRYVLMDRLHVTRSYALAANPTGASGGHCVGKRAGADTNQSGSDDNPNHWYGPHAAPVSLPQ